MTRTQQRETKLVFLEPRMAEALGELLLAQRDLFGFPARERTPRERFLDAYFDTEDGRLEAAGQVLRRRARRGGIHWQTKLLRTRRGNEAAYETREVASESATPPPELVDAALDLVEVLRVQVAREGLAVATPDGEVLVLLDRIDYSTPRAESLGTAIEVEVKARSDSSAIDPIVEHLRVAFGLVPATRSKLQKGLVLRRARQGRRRPVILDMDPGVDDAIALALALASPELHVLAVTTVGGNVGLDRTTRNAVLLVEHLSRLLDCSEAPVVARGGMPPGELPDASGVHGRDGLGGWATRRGESEIRASDEPAVDLIARLLTERPGEVALISTGPLTNLAACAERHPEALANARELIAMGGVFFQPGNRSAAAEFNVHRDPLAAAILVGQARRRRFPGGPVVLPLTFVGLDVTHSVRLMRRDLEGDRPLTALLRELSGTYMDFYRRNEGLDGCYLHDPLAVALAIDPSLCEVEPFHVEVETAGRSTNGMTLADARPTRLFGNVEDRVTGVCVTVDAERARRTILGRLGLLDGRSTADADPSTAPRERPRSSRPGERLGG